MESDRWFQPNSFPFDTQIDKQTRKLEMIRFPFGRNPKRHLQSVGPSDGSGIADGGISIVTASRLMEKSNLSGPLGQSSLSWSRGGKP